MSLQGHLRVSAGVGGDQLIVQGSREALLVLATIGPAGSRSVDPLVESGVVPLETIEFALDPRQASGFGVAAAHRQGTVRIVGFPGFAGLERFLALTVAPNGESEIAELGWHTHLTLDADIAIPGFTSDWIRLAGITFAGPNQVA